MMAVSEQASCPRLCLQLYTTAGCHLCEIAESLLQQLDEQVPLNLASIEISIDEALVQRYGIRIPVVRRQDGQELGWPFDLHSLYLFATQPPAAPLRD